MEHEQLALGLQVHGHVLNEAELTDLIESTADLAEPATAEILGDVTELVEKAVTSDGSIQIKIASPGWGSSGYYTKELLERDGPKAFGVGTQMFWDHPTAAEERDRPEGSLRSLAAMVTSTPTFLEEGPNGPGLYGTAKVFSGFKEAVDELGPHIGLSMRAAGKVREGFEAEGRKGRLVEQIVHGKSVDFVTQAGRGGEVVSLFESYREGGTNVSDTQVTPDQKTPEQVAAEQAAKETEEAAAAKAKADAEAAAAVTTTPTTDAPAAEAKRDTEVARLQERLARKDAKDVVQSLIESKGNVPAATAARLIESLPLQATVDADGEFEATKFRAIAEAALTAELTYIAEASGAGRVRGMGGTNNDPKATEQFKESKDGVKAALVKLGMSDKEAEAALR